MIDVLHFLFFLFWAWTVFCSQFWLGRYQGNSDMIRSAAQFWIWPLTALEAFFIWLRFF